MLPSNSFFNYWALKLIETLKFSKNCFHLFTLTSFYALVVEDVSPDDDDDDDDDDSGGGPVGGGPVGGENAAVISSRAGYLLTLTCMFIGKYFQYFSWCKTSCKLT